LKSPRQLFLHIGRPKTGSTALQNALSRNSAVLADSGILYPDVGIIDGAHHLVAKSLLDIVPAAIEHLPHASFTEEVSKIKSQFNAGGFHSLVLSSEFFTLLTNEKKAPVREKIKAAFNDFEIIIVVYLREQLGQFDSAFNQEVRNKQLKSYVSLDDFYTEYLRRKGNDYHYLVSQWQQTFGAPQVVVRAIERGRLQGDDILEDFLDRIGSSVKLKSKIVTSGYDNSSISYSRLMLLNALGGLPFSEQERQTLFSVFMCTPLFDGEQASGSVLDEQRQLDILSQYELSNKSLVDILPECERQSFFYARQPKKTFSIEGEDFKVFVFEFLQTINKEQSALLVSIQEKLASLANIADADRKKVIFTIAQAIETIKPKKKKRFWRIL